MAAQGGSNPPCSIGWLLIWMNLDVWSNQQTDNLLLMQCIAIIIHGSLVYRIKFVMLYILLQVNIPRAVTQILGFLWDIFFRQFLFQPGGRGSFFKIKQLFRCDDGAFYPRCRDSEHCGQIFRSGGGKPHFRGSFLPDSRAN